MAVINLTSEELANRIEEMLDLASKGDNVLIHHEGKTYTVIPISEDVYKRQYQPFYEYYQQMQEQKEGKE